jgi:hypothetical protein
MAQRRPHPLLKWLQLQYIPPRPPVLRTPFRRLPSHRIPTLWHLFRALLRNAPNDTLREIVRTNWKRLKSQSSPNKVIAFLKTEQEVQISHSCATRRGNFSSKSGSDSYWIFFGKLMRVAETFLPSFPSSGRSLSSKSTAPDGSRSSSRVLSTYVIAALHARVSLHSLS